VYNQRPRNGVSERAFDDEKEWMHQRRGVQAEQAARQTARAAVAVGSAQRFDNDYNHNHDHDPDLEHCEYFLFFLYPPC
jgi:hypothetical protein